MNDSRSASNVHLTGGAVRKPRFDLELPLDTHAAPSVSGLIKRALARSAPPGGHSDYAPTEWQATDWMDTCSPDLDAKD